MEAADEEETVQLAEEHVQLGAVGLLLGLLTEMRSEEEGGRDAGGRREMAEARGGKQDLTRSKKIGTSYGNNQN